MVLSDISNALVDGEKSVVPVYFGACVPMKNSIVRSIILYLRRLYDCHEKCLTCKTIHDVNNQ
jgi:flavoprotein